MYFRLHVSETPLFKKISVKNQYPIKSLVLDYRGQLLMGISIAIFPTLFIIFGHYLPAYLGQFTLYHSKSVYLYMLFGMITFAIAAPLFSYILDIINKPIMILLIGFIALLCVLSFVYNKQVNNLLMFILGYKLLSATFIAYFPHVLAGLFPTNIRYSGIAMSYNIAFIFSAILLLLTTFLVKSQQTYNYIIILFLGIALFNMFISIKYICMKKEGVFK